MGDTLANNAGCVLVVYQGDKPTDVIDAVTPHAREVLAVDIGGDDAMQTIRAAVDCVVVDWRVVDFTGVGIIFGTRAGQLIPQLIMHDDRPGWDADYLRNHLGARDMLVHMIGMDVNAVVSNFMHGIGVRR